MGLRLQYEPMCCDALVDSRVLDTVLSELIEQMTTGLIPQTQSTDTDTRQSSCVFVSFLSCPTVVAIIVVVVKVVVFVIAVDGVWRYDPRNIRRCACKEQTFKL